MVEKTQASLTARSQILQWYNHCTHASETLHHSSSRRILGLIMLVSYPWISILLLSFSRRLSCILGSTVNRSLMVLVCKMKEDPKCLQPRSREAVGDYRLFDAKIMEEKVTQFLLFTEIHHWGFYTNFCWLLDFWRLLFSSKMSGFRRIKQFSSMYGMLSKQDTRGFFKMKNNPSNIERQYPLIQSNIIFISKYVWKN